MSKAAKIKQLYAQGMSVAQIAEIIGCDPAYVRVCARQRIIGGMSVHDIAWQRTDAYLKIKRERRLERYWSDPEFRQRTIEAQRRSRSKQKSMARAQAP